MTFSMLSKMFIYDHLVTIMFFGFCLLFDLFKKHILWKRIVMNSELLADKLLSLYDIMIKQGKGTVGIKSKFVATIDEHTLSTDKIAQIFRNSQDKIICNSTSRNTPHSDLTDNLCCYFRTLDPKFDITEFLNFALKH